MSLSLIDVITEHETLLTFVSDKINTLPYDMIVKLLVDFYSDDDIASAKNILYQTAFKDRDAPRLIKRKGKDRCLNNIQDILNIFLEMPPQSVPCYVAKELSRLPPLSINCFDVSSLVKDMESVKLHLLILQESHETLLKAQLDKCQVRSSPESVSAEHHFPRSACAVSIDMDDQHVIDVVDKSECTDDDLVLLASIQQTTPPPTHRQRKGVNNNRQTSVSTQASRNTYAESVTRGRRQPNNHGRPASLTTTQTDSAMIRGMARRPIFAPLTQRDVRAHQKPENKWVFSSRDSQDRPTPKTWPHTSSERLACLCHVNL